MKVSEQELNIRILESSQSKMQKKFETTIQEIRNKYEECRKNLRASDDELLKHKQLCEKLDEDLEEAKEELAETKDELRDHKDGSRKLRQEHRMLVKEMQDSLKEEKNENIELNKALISRNDRIDELEEQIRKLDRDLEVSTEEKADLTRMLSAKDDLSSENTRLHENMDAALKKIAESREREKRFIEHVTDVFDIISPSKQKQLDEMQGFAEEDEEEEDDDEDDEDDDNEHRDTFDTPEKKRISANSGATSKAVGRSISMPLENTNAGRMGFKAGGGALSKLRRTVLSNPDKAVSMDRAKSIRARSTQQLTIAGKGGPGASAWGVAALRARMSKYESTLSDLDSTSDLIHDDEQQIEVALKKIAENRKNLEVTLAEKNRQLDELASSKEIIANSSTELATAKKHRDEMASSLKESQEKLASVEAQLAELMLKMERNNTELKEIRKNHAAAIAEKDKKIEELTQKLVDAAHLDSSILSSVASEGDVLCSSVQSESGSEESSETHEVEINIPVA